jgi:hypothetical protein
VSPRHIGCFTDVPVGYGSPQIQYLLRALAEHYGGECLLEVCQPRSDAYPDVGAELPDLKLCNVEYPDAATSFWFADGGGGQEHLASGFRTWLDQTRPDVLVLTGFNSLRYLDPATAFATWRPYVIHYALEFLARTDMDASTASRHQASVKVVDLLLFTEANRRAYYNREFGTTAVPQAMVLNVPPIDRFPVRPATARNGRLLVQSASIQWGLTYPEFLATTNRPRIPVDVYGLIYDGPARILDAPESASAFGVRYLGAITNAQLSQRRCDYAYSFVAWAPAQFNTLFACPNKLFESIASGVPPITAPHPQCADIVGAYDCGIVMRDWSYGAFCDALDVALTIHGTPRYRELVRNCVHAHRSALNWERQFGTVANFLPDLANHDSSPEGLRYVMKEPAAPKGRATS